MIHTIDHHQATSAAKRVTRTVNDRYPTLALAAAMPALVVVGVLDAVVPVVVNSGTDADVEAAVVTELRPETDAEVVATELELVVPKLVEVEMPEEV